MQIKLTKRPMFWSQKALKATLSACLSLVRSEGKKVVDVLEGEVNWLRCNRAYMSPRDIEQSEECIRQLQRFGDVWPL